MPVATPVDSQQQPTPAAAPARRRGVRTVLEHAAAALLVGAVLWFVAQALLAVALLVAALLAALLLTALLEPIAHRVRRLGAPPALAAAVATLGLLLLLTAVGLLVYNRSTAQLAQLPGVLTLAIDAVRTWLITGPPGLDPEQVTQLRNAAVDYLAQATPTALKGAMTALRVLSAALLTVFAVFFLLKDGGDLWRWLLRWSPSGARERVDVSGRAAWEALSGYVRGTVVVAAVDAVSIGLVLVVLDVPLWLSLTVLTFLGAFVPLLGATVAGAAAVLVTAATEGGRDAVIVLVAVLVVQQLEGNLLQPLIMSHAVRLHPLAILSAVTAGVLVLGVAGALLAVPLLAVTYRAACALREHTEGQRQQSTG